MRKKLFKLYYKLIFSSLAYWLYVLLFVGFCMFFLVVVFWGEIGEGLNCFQFLNSSVYNEIPLAAFSFLIAVYFVRKDSTMETVCLIPESKYLIIKMIALITASWLICLIPIIYCAVITVVQQTEILFGIKTAIFFCLRWMIIILMMETLGFLIGRTVKSAFVYLLSAPIIILFSCMNGLFFNAFNIYHLIPGWVSTLLSAQHLFVQAIPVDYASPLFDLLYFTKLLVMVTFSAVLIYVIYLICAKKTSARRFIVLGLFVVVFGLSAFWYKQLFPIQYNPADKLFVTGNRDEAYSISSYSGNIKLSETCFFDCIVTVNGDGSGKALRLRLDETLEPESISCDEKEIEYSRNGDYLIIDDPLVTERNSCKIDMKYSGRIYYISPILTVNIFASTYNAALPPNFAFLPLIDGDCESKDFNLEIRSRGNLISNLNVTQGDKDVFYIKGENDTICLFSGDFEEQVIDGITFYRTKNDITDLDAEYERQLRNSHWDYKTMTITDDPYTVPKKVFQIYFLYDTGNIPVLFEDYLIINNIY